MALPPALGSALPHVGRIELTREQHLAFDRVRYELEAFLMDLAELLGAHYGARTKRARRAWRASRYTDVLRAAIWAAFPRKLLVENLHLGEYVQPLVPVARNRFLTRYPRPGTGLLGPMPLELHRRVGDELRAHSARLDELCSSYGNSPWKNERGAFDAAHRARILLDRLRVSLKESLLAEGSEDAPAADLRGIYEGREENGPSRTGPRRPSQPPE